MKNGKFVYKTENAILRMHDFYDRTLADLQGNCNFPALI